MKKILLFAFVIAPFVKTFSQLEAAVQAKIDSIFQPWNTKTSPGVAIAIVKDGKIIFSKGYGMSNLEYDIPITPASIFHIASESKKYTAFCIQLLAKQGKLSLDDDIRKHLPYVPDFGKKITIQHLISHTSGLRDQWQSLVIAGGQMDDVITQDHVIKFVSKLKELNFEPGERMMYCNTGYTLMAEIVKKVSGQDIRKFADENIFKPLGMSNTHFHDFYKEIVKNRTYSYDPIYEPTGIKYTNSVLSYSTVGATSLFTTVEDEAKWLINYGTLQVGDKALFERVFKTGMLNNGNTLEYASGLFISKYKGHRRIGHGGADAGYRTYSCYFPDEKLGLVLFSNLRSINVDPLAGQVADVLLDIKSHEKKSDTKPGADTGSYKYYTGSYLSAEDGSLVVSSRGSGMFIKMYGYETPMKHDRENTYSIYDGFISIQFEKPVNGKSPSLRMTPFGGNGISAKRYTPVALNESNLSRYAGIYYSDELDVTYYIVKEKGQLVMRHRKHPDGTLNALTPRQFSCSSWWMSNLLFSSNDKGSISGFQVNTGRVLRLKFKKVK